MAGLGTGVICLVYRKYILWKCMYRKYISCCTALIYSIQWKFTMEIHTRFPFLVQQCKQWQDRVFKKWAEMGEGKSISLLIRENISYKPSFEVKKIWLVRHAAGNKEKHSGTLISHRGSAWDCGSWLCWTKVIWLTNSYYLNGRN